MVQPPLEAIGSFTLPARVSEITPAPIARAHHRAITEGVPSMARAPHVEPAVGRPAGGAPLDDDARDGSIDIEISVEPTAPSSPRRSRRRWWLAAAAGAVAVIAGSLLAIQVGARRAAPVVERAAVPAVVPAPPSSLEVAPAAAEVAPPLVEVAPPAAAEVAAPVEVSRPTSRRPAARKRPVEPQAPKPRWDPGALFPE